MKPRITIVSPYLAEANNGNWRTADRWHRMLSKEFNTIVQAGWTIASNQCEMLVALHARRSASSIVAFRKANPSSPLILVLTGTDLYRDIPDDANAMDSLALADALVVLQEDALNFIPKPFRTKAHVIYQSCRLLVPARRPSTFLRCIAVGHLREEKAPETIIGAMETLPPKIKLQFIHIGAPLDKSLEKQARAMAKRDCRYRYLGALPHGETRQAIRHSHLLVHPSRMEGGANVIAEAITSQTGVLASRVSGNIGMLGKDYPGYFRVGDSADLAAKLGQCAHPENLAESLIRITETLKRRFAPDTERAAILALVHKMFSQRAGNESGVSLST